MQLKIAELRSMLRSSLTLLNKEGTELKAWSPPYQGGFRGIETFAYKQFLKNQLSFSSIPDRPSYLRSGGG